MLLAEGAYNYVKCLVLFKEEYVWVGIEINASKSKYWYKIKDNLNIKRLNRVTADVMVDF